MKVTTLNLAGYKSWHEREANIISYLEDTESNIVFLQEVKFDAEFSSSLQSKYLNSRLTSPYPYTQASVSRIYESSNGNSSREGLAVLSVYPIVDSEVLVLRKRADDKHTRIIQTVRLLINDRVVSFVNVHFSNNQYSDEQLEETLQFVKDSGERSVILGDFNIFDIKTVRHLYAAEYIASTQVSEYISFPSEGVTLDYVLVPLGYKLSSLTTGENISDHNAVSFELEI